MPVSPALLLLVPLAYLIAAILPERLFGARPERRWPLSLGVATAAPLFAIFAVAALSVSGPAVGSVSLGGVGGAWTPTVHLDALTVVMLLLITGIALVILRYSRRYLDGEAWRQSYLRWFLATMACASLLVVTNDLLVLALAWTALSVTFHQLLTFYDDRPSALIAAHKKFLMSRAADVAILGSVALVWWSFRTLRIDALVEQAAALQSLPGTAHVAGVLLAIGIVLRTAQLPFHGWLIQVMEAPTPVSAFLHAGIVNIGGFVLIRLSGLVGRLDVAQTLLVVVGTLTAVLAALVMMTRISVKVSLAWSTCAQMGFMLLECGLGAYGLALLHLVAHSLYKAHAFLSSGRAVEQQQMRRMAPQPARITIGHWAFGAIISAVVVGSLGVAVSLVPWLEVDADSGNLAAAFILALALAPLFVRGSIGDARAALRGALVAVGLVTAYVTAHSAFSAIAPSVSGAAVMNVVRLGFVVVAFLALYVVQSAIAAFPTGRIARALYPACFAGFYLDEIWTRLTFEIWPPRAMPAPETVATSSIRTFQELPA